MNHAWGTTNIFLGIILSTVHKEYEWNNAHECSGIFLRCPVSLDHACPMTMPMNGTKYREDSTDWNSEYNATEYRFRAQDGKIRPKPW